MGWLRLWRPARVHRPAADQKHLISVPGDLYIFTYVCFKSWKNKVFLEGIDNDFFGEGGDCFVVFQEKGASCAENKPMGGRF